MDIAVTGLAPIILPDHGRNRSRPDTAQVNPDRQNTSRNPAGTETQLENSRAERVVRGEVLSSAIQQERTATTPQNAFAESPSNFNQSDTRQISIGAALQNYQDNEALIAEPDQPRQVSGIIDVYV